MDRKAAPRTSTASSAAAAPTTAPAPAAPTTAGTKRKAKAPVEKRARRYRSKCPDKLQERIQRAATQRLYLVRRDEVNVDLDANDDADANDNDNDGECKYKCNFVVLGSTGNVYTVTLQDVPHCTCPDFARKQDLCKHVLFVYLKVVGLPVSNPLVYQKALLRTDLREIFSILSQRRVGGTVASVLANDRVRESYARLEGGETALEEGDLTDQVTRVKRRALDEGESDCPICFDPMSGGADTTFCRAMCGNNFHAECIRIWLREQRDKTCPNCRQPWDDGKATALQHQHQGQQSPKSPEGYVNLGTIQGQPSTRDTSTYRSSPYKRNRYW
jgi:hypothetical protein